MSFSILIIGGALVSVIVLAGVVGLIVLLLNRPSDERRDPRDD